jgi:hypothetical protein
MDLNLFRLDIKKIPILHISKVSAAAKKPPTFAVIDKFWKKMVAASWQVISKPFYFFCFDFLHIDPSNNFFFATVLP